MKPGETFIVHKVKYVAIENNDNARCGNCDSLNCSLFPKCSNDPNSKVYNKNGYNLYFKRATR